MNRLTSWIRLYPGWSYLGLAMAITWTLIAPAALAALGMIPWTPPEIWHGLGALGPVLAAGIVIAARDGRAGLHSWLGALTRWRVGAGWLLLAVLSPLAMLVLAVLAGRVADGRWADFGPALHAPYGPPWIATTLILALAYGFGEEPGWRGFLLPHLGQRFGQVTTILLLTLAWGVWHGLMFVYRLPNAPVMMVGFFIGLLAGSIWLAWLYERTHSILVVALWHAVWNIVNIPALLVSEYGCGRAQHPGDGAGDYHQHRLVLAAPQARSKQPRGPVEVAHTRLGHAGCAAVRGDSPGRFLPRGPVIWRLKAPD